MSLNLYTPKIVLSQYSTKFPNFNFFNPEEKKITRCEVLEKRFHMDGHTVRFPSQTQKLESPQDFINHEWKC